MVRVREFIDTDVFTESVKRIHHVYETFDSVVVMFSGGKDSSVVLNLARRVLDERGEKDRKVHAVFRDEELIPQSVVDLVNHYRQQPWLDMRWLAVPLKSRKYILGESKEYIQWDPDRRWIRPKPEWGEIYAEDPCRVFDQHSMDAWTARSYTGRIAFMTGIRATESLVRYRACVEKLHENYITKPTPYGRGIQIPNNVRLVKPIFDWSEDDVFKAAYEEGWPYARIYDQQLFGRDSLRVATPLHQENAKVFHKLAWVDPVLYQQVIDVFPEMLAHARYFREFDRDGLIEKIAKNFGTIEAWIRENVHGEDLNLALMRLRYVRMRHYNQPESYPMEYIARKFVNGTFKRDILPCK